MKRHECDDLTDSEWLEYVKACKKAMRRPSTQTKVLILAFIKKMMKQK